MTKYRWAALLLLVLLFIDFDLTAIVFGGRTVALVALGALIGTLIVTIVIIMRMV